MWKKFKYYWHLIDTNGLDNNHDISCAWLVACILVSGALSFTFVLAGIVDSRGWMVLGGVLALPVGYLVGIIPGAVCTYFMIKRGEGSNHIAKCMSE